MKRNIETLERIERLFDNWNNNGSISLIERDTILRLIGTLYEEVYFSSVASAEHVAETAVGVAAAVETEPEPEPIAEQLASVKERVLAPEPIAEPVAEPSESEAPVAAEFEVADNSAPEPIEPQPEDDEFETISIPKHKIDRKTILSIYNDTFDAPQNEPTPIAEPEPISAPEEYAEPTALAEEQEFVSDEPIDEPIDEPFVPAEPVAEEFASADEPEPIAEEFVAADNSEPEPFEPQPASEPVAEEPVEFAAEPKPYVIFGSETVESEHEPESAESEPETSATENDSASSSTNDFESTIVIPEERITVAESVTSLRESIGLNDKFLLMADLFSNDNTLYEQTIDTLDEFSSLDEALLFIHDNYRWNANSKGAELLIDLLARKLL